MIYGWKLKKSLKVEEKKEDRYTVMHDKTLRKSLGDIMQLTSYAFFVYMRDKNNSNLNSFIFFVSVLFKKLLLINEFGENPTSKQMKEFDSKLDEKKTLLEIISQFKNN